MPLAIKSLISRARSNVVGIDGISLKLLRLTFRCLMPIVEHLFNFSLMNGVFLMPWKSALICPILKIKNPTSVQHYRLISILPTLSKALERIVWEQIHEYLENLGLHDPCQSAYRNNYSTQTCLIRMLYEVRHAAEGKLIRLINLYVILCIYIPSKIKCE